MDSSALGLTCLAAAIGMAIAAAGCGIGQGMGLKAACEGTARNPEAGGKIMVTLILGLAFVESLAIYALVVNLILLFANPFMG
ncbi:MAG TPA: ATP synthase F0 subunit C [Desulfovibrio sp.]|uniref:ATP synthase subunit c n=3 Tax=Nitratidesulfovibrio vulgaris TaxID=881 RepID=ATPL_NITV2|nr:RecName: Full=ATP synthase subunit c; AltName: Full=ATP synthase F(0) sector subunit c; AltName: Full=F-type ATPase subunit c; Short=F-ATPase subunit c; AltName: Full=Lipid-binding protein [Nitratidesulfovibrio vulgaris DP4]Q72DL2.1 RecName: Full=ATP synthase subunit c; AltName: Full=ATP synthase F(0) sector subunit c; AltName: Full=F-type ATPase subunit c; Short=F-ATPase subunit c; AltName: Full=Lipid-binding protein [Nitratidesulfovibrio vulgaris str. Hildenborough]AAS95397.1 ATP synthase F0